MGLLSQGTWLLPYFTAEICLKGQIPAGEAPPAYTLPPSPGSPPAASNNINLLGEICYIPDTSWAHSEGTAHAGDQLQGGAVALGAIGAPQPCELGLSRVWDTQPPLPTGQGEHGVGAVCTFLSTTLWCNAAVAPY